jgi:uncharacterized protein (DUF3084 family)
VVAKRNTLFGEEVPIYFKVVENRLVYKAGNEIAQIDIAAGLSTPEIEQEIKRLLYNTHRSAKEAGVLPDPTGSVGSVPYSKILALAKKIKAYGKGIKIKTLAATDTYTLGPLEITFKTLYR